MTADEQQLVSNLLKDERIERFGWTPLKRPFSFELYEDWLGRSFHGEMEYLVRHAPQKSNPESLLPQAQSALVVAIDYGPDSEFEVRSREDFKFKNARVALYARGNDYHIWLTEKLNRIVLRLQEKFPGHVFAAYSDSSPVLERDLAARAGLGWVGKNTCLIDTKGGSLFFIGEIFTSLAVGGLENLHADRCGTCTRCIDICPTQAIVEPRVLDARLCLSYLTIESKNAPKDHLRKSIGDWLYGCDLCQTICPWNEKAYGKEMMQDEVHNLRENRLGLIKELKWILKSPDSEIENRLSATPLLRRRAYGLKRNALIVAGNRKLTELKRDIETFRIEQLDILERHVPPSPKTEDLIELCNWALDNVHFPLA